MGSAVSAPDNRWIIGDRQEAVRCREDIAVQLPNGTRHFVQIPCVLAPAHDGEHTNGHGCYWTLRWEDE